jgi:soluble lytic murein transglycosylase-like protein
MRICFYVLLLTVGLLSMSLSPLVAETIAEASPPASKPVAAAPRVVSVVRANPRTGRLVRTFIAVSSVVTGKPVQHRNKPQAIAAAASEVEAFIEEAALAYDVPSELVHSVIQVESSYNPYAISYKGAQGLMQLMPATARRFGVTNPFDPKQNIEGGVKYLKFLQDTFKDDRLAIAAYNAGEKAVAKYNNNVPPYPETVSYVARVGKKYEKARRDSESRKQVVAQAAKPAESKPAEPQYRSVEQFVDAEGRLHLVTR